jgi:AhpD family alkylhydroperoxidase
MSGSSSRIEWQEYKDLAPEAYAALTALSRAVSASGLDKGLIELVKIRASQINGCAFCTQFHLTLARQLHVAGEKLDLLAAWRDAGIYTAREQAALAWTEKLTRVATEHVSNEDYAAVAAEFSRAEVAALTTAIGLINTWNRIAGPLQFTPQIAQPAHA